MTLIAFLSLGNADVVIDMPAPPAAKSVAPAGLTPLDQFAHRDIAQDASGRARGTNWPVLIDQVPTGYQPSWDWYDRGNWGWPGYWALQPLWYGGGWTGSQCTDTVFSGTWMGGSGAVNMRLGQTRCW